MHHIAGHEYSFLPFDVGHRGGELAVLHFEKCHFERIISNFIKELSKTKINFQEIFVDPNPFTSSNNS